MHSRPFIQVACYHLLGSEDGISTADMLTEGRLVKMWKTRFRKASFHSMQNQDLHKFRKDRVHCDGNQWQESGLSHQPCTPGRVGKTSPTSFCSLFHLLKSENNIHNVVLIRERCCSEVVHFRLESPKLLMLLATSFGKNGEMITPSLDQVNLV